MLNDRYVRANDGRALVVGISNGELSVWTAPTPRDVVMRDHRARDTVWGWSHRRTLQRFARDHVWFAGFGYAEGERIPWRTNIPVVGVARAICLPLWLPGLLFGILPLRLIVRNMQSSAEFLAQRAAEREARELEALAQAASSPIRPSPASPSSTPLPSPAPVA
jgi:hypothetical protein